VFSQLDRLLMASLLCFLSCIVVLLTEMYDSATGYLLYVASVTEPLDQSIRPVTNQVNFNTSFLY